MEKIRFFLLAVAGIVFAACSSDDLQEVTAPTVTIPEVTEAPILFSSVKSSTTRGESTGAAAAELLNNKFVVFGYKGSSTAGYTSANKVFDNYVVEYEWNTENKTESNTSNWEYVGKSKIPHASITSQKVKYWDYGQAQYDFIAWSTGKKTADYSGSPASGQVYVSAIAPVPAASPEKALTSAYTFEGAKDDLVACYISDLVTRKKSGTAGYGTVIGYSDDPVTMKFRQLGAKVRMAIYETVPGYSVKDVKFYSAASNALLDETDATNGAANATANKAAKLFTTASDIHSDGTYIVYFPTVDASDKVDNNQAHVKFHTGTDITTIDWGALNYTSKEDGEKSDGIYLGRSSSTATFAGDASKNYYVSYMPNEDGTNLNLRVNYTLESTDGSGEVINVKGATAQVPLKYTQWKAGYAYTYIFKISDKTNGHTGDYDPTNPGTSTDPVGLYPITFDAVVENTEDNDVTQETITLVSTPSITTYQEASTVVNANEYTASGKDIFVTVSENDALVDLNGKAALYTLSADKTEAEVIDALQIRADGATGTIKGRNGLVLTEVTKETSTTATDLTGKYKLTDAVEYGADGNAISVGTDKALRFKPAANTTYAFVYTQSAFTSETPKYIHLEKNVGDDVTGLYRFKYSQTSGDANSYTQYYANASGAYTPVTSASVYFGQSLSGYFTRTGEGTTENPYVYHPYSSGSTSSTGGIYYYTEDTGATYKQATNIAFADFAGATDLYTYDGANYTQKPTTVTIPADGIKYYQKTTTGDVDTYTLCVILPQQVNGWFTMNTLNYEKVTESTAVSWQSYFDRYAQNNGVYYTKVIKVQ